MSKVKIEGNASGTGTLTISAPATNTDRSLTLPDGAGEILTDASNITVQATENVPIFRAYQNASRQTFSNYTWTKVVLDATEFDKGSYFDTTNYRYTPQVEGYYQFFGQVYFRNGSWEQTHTALKKNNTTFITFNLMYYTGWTVDDTNRYVSDIIYLNGSTDYVELFMNGKSDGTPDTDNGIDRTKLTGSLIRAGA